MIGGSGPTCQPTKKTEVAVTSRRRVQMLYEQSGKRATSFIKGCVFYKGTRETHQGDTGAHPRAGLDHKTKTGDAPKYMTLVLYTTL